MNCEKHKSECTECVKEQIKELEDKLAEPKKKLPPCSCPLIPPIYFPYQSSPTPLTDKVVW